METKYIVNNLSAQTITGNLAVSGTISGGTFYGDGSSLTGITGGGLVGTNYVFVSASGTDIENATELQAAYSTAQTMSPSATSRITIIAGPGYYNFESTNFTMDTQYIDLVSLDGNRSIIFNSSNANGTINITANNVYVKGVDVGTNKSFLVADSLNLLKVENCRGGDYSFGDLFSSGIFKDCIGGNFSFGGGDTADGVFTNCIGGNYSFGGSQEASGTFTNCISGDYSFGPSYASGTFTNCVGGDSSFGFNVDLTGKLFYCRLTAGTFRTVSLSGVTRFCLDGTNTANNQG